MYNDPLLNFASVDNILRMATAPRVQPQPVIPPYAPEAAPQPLYPALPQQPNPPLVLQEQYRQPATPMKPITPNDLGLYTQLVRQTESSNNYQAKNPTTSASGAYQYINSTWDNYGGYPEARLAPKAVQDAKFNEDTIKKLRRFNGDPFKMIADHMLPIQANKPELWTQPSVLMHRGKPRRIPPVADYIRKVVKGSPWERQFEQYLAAQGATR